MTSRPPCARCPNPATHTRPVRGSKDERLCTGCARKVTAAIDLRVASAAAGRPVPVEEPLTLNLGATA